MKTRRKTKNTPYICLQCFKTFYVENKQRYPYYYLEKDNVKIPLCSLKCTNEYLEMRRRGKRLGLNYNLREVKK